ncbi:MAG: DUF3592 domain-containing protein [Solirubrobacteraceae bacterium]
MITRVVAGILAIVFVSLGLTFTVIGLAVDRSGSSEGFLSTGIGMLAAGAACAAVFAVLTRRDAERRHRRRAGARAQAQIVRAVLRPGVRIGSLLAYDLTVRFQPAGEATRRLLVVPGTALVEGESIEVAYDPQEPSNFEPTSTQGHWHLVHDPG